MRGPTAYLAQIEGAGSIAVRHVAATRETDDQNVTRAHGKAGARPGKGPGKLAEAGVKLSETVQPGKFTKKKSRDAVFLRGANGSPRRRPTNASNAR